MAEMNDTVEKDTTANKELTALEINRQIAVQEQDILRQIAEAEHPDKVTDLLSLFKVEQAKRAAVRIAKVSDLSDLALSKLLDNYVNNPNNLTNQELVTSIQAFALVQEKLNKQLQLIDEQNPIQYVQQNLNINMTDGQLNKESRDRVAETVRKILAQQQFIKENDESDIEDKLIETDEPNF